MIIFTFFMYEIIFGLLFNVEYLYKKKLLDSILKCSWSQYFDVIC